MVNSFIVVGGAVFADLLLGDPQWMPHPVVLMGRAISKGESVLWTGDDRRDFFSGAALSLSVIGISAGAAYLILVIGALLGSRIEIVIAIALGWTTLAIRSLDRAAAAVEVALRANDESAARAHMPALVGREPASLDRNGMIRATIESLAESCCDGIIAPMLYLFVGGPVAAIAYKAINTLDSMLGHHDQRYEFFGKFAARLDDVANYIPARLAAAAIAAVAALNGRANSAVAAIARDAKAHASLNAGYPEAAMAGALGIQLGGLAIYDGVAEKRALLGSSERAPRIDDIRQARMIVLTGTAIFFFLMSSIRLLIAL